MPPLRSQSTLLLVAALFSALPLQSRAQERPSAERAALGVRGSAGLQRSFPGEPRSTPRADGTASGFGAEGRAWLGYDLGGTLAFDRWEWAGTALHRVRAGPIVRAAAGRIEVEAALGYEISELPPLAGRIGVSHGVHLGLRAAVPLVSAAAMEVAAELPVSLWSAYGAEPAQRTMPAIEVGGRLTVLRAARIELRARAGYRTEAHEVSVRPVRASLRVHQALAGVEVAWVEEAP